MAIWMELRCEGRGDGKFDENGSRCWSDDNSGPHGMAFDTCRSASLVAKELFAEAIEGGWKRTKDGFICPHCAGKEEASNGKA